MNDFSDSAVFLTPRPYVTCRQWSYTNDPGQVFHTQEIFLWAPERKATHTIELSLNVESSYKNCKKPSQIQFNWSNRLQSTE